MTKPLLIGEVIRAANVSLESLRRWERQGLLTPERDSSNRRLYSAADLALAKRMARVKVGKVADRLKANGR